MISASILEQTVEQIVYSGHGLYGNTRLGIEHDATRGRTFIEIRVRYVQFEHGKVDCR